MGRKALADFGRGGQPNGFDLLQQAIADSGPGPDQLWKTFGKDLTGTRRGPTDKLAHLELQDHPAPSTGNVVNRSLILAVNSIRAVSTSWAMCIRVGGNYFHGELSFGKLSLAKKHPFG